MVITSKTSYIPKLEWKDNLVHNKRLCLAYFASIHDTSTHTSWLELVPTLKEFLKVLRLVIP